MKKSSTGKTFVGLDVHKESIDVTLPEEGPRGEVKHFGAIGGDLEAVDKLLQRLRRAGRELHFVYEAGPCGYEIWRFLRARQEDCIVVSPALIPKRPGDRIKTNRRDSQSLARLHRAGELAAIYVPAPEDEAIRDLSRARGDVLRARQKARQQLRALLLRNSKRYPRKCAWTPAHRRWLCDLRFDHPAHKITLEEYLGTIDEMTRRIERLEQALAEQAANWRMAPVVDALQALRGVKLITAITLVTELGDLSRFHNPRQLMAFLGLVPSEHSTGEKRRLGAITKCGNTHARKALVEAAWAYRHPAKIGRSLQKRSENLPSDIRTIAWKAQLRLTARYRKLLRRAKPTQLIVTALARELSGFVWDIARRTPFNA